ncbi:MAG: hypothetical protein RLZZ502_1609 [Pseudomonadota bacterium]|jgi:sec-independent protein translocase protein TatC
MSSAPSTDTAVSESFISHLVELRQRVIYAALAVIIATIVLAIYPGMSQLYSIVAKPLLQNLPQGGTMIATDVTGTFMVPLKVIFMAGFLLALPVVLYQIWAFVAPGLYQHEKKLILPLIVSSTVLFFVGMAFAYFIFFPSVFHFFSSLTPSGVQMATDIEKYFSFVLTMFVAFGITFETPVVVVSLIMTGVVSRAKLAEWRSYVFLGAFVVGAIFTPPDVLSQFMLAIPLYLLFELGLMVAKFLPEKKENSEDAAQ